MSSPFLIGSEQAEEAAKRPSFARTAWFSLEDRESAVVRMLTDHNRLLTVMQHNSSPTRPAPPNYQGKWPKAMSGVCRMNTGQGGARTFPEHADCYLCNKFAETGDKRSFKPGERSWGLAIVRKPVMSGGRAVGFENDTVEVEVEGKKIIVPKVVVLNFAWGNFWSNFSTITDLFGTWCDRDIFIKRDGTELDTKYPMQAYPEYSANGIRVGDVNDPDEVTAHGRGVALTDAPGGKKYDSRDSDLMVAMNLLPALGISESDFKSKYGGNIENAVLGAVIDIVTERASDNYYARFFDERLPQPTNEATDTGGATGGGETQKPASNEPSEAELAALAQRIQGHLAPGAEAPAAAGAPAPGLPPLS